MTGNAGARLHRLVLALVIIAVVCAVAAASAGRFPS
jgi:hypothetical protein